MATYISLINWTEQGLKGFKDSIKRAEAFERTLEQQGGSLKEIYWTVGQYDIVAIADAPNAETITSVLLQVGALGNVRTTTLQAFDKDTFATIVNKAG